MRLVMHCLLAGTFALLSGCKDEESRAPRAPSSGGTAATGAIGTMDGGFFPGHRDGGGMSGEDDGGEDPIVPIDGAVLADECKETPAVQIPADEVGDDVLASTTSPADFEVTRVVGAWQGDCSAPVFRIELSNGECPDGQGHELSFAIDGNAIRDGSLRLGLTSILPEPNETGVSIRYVRPEPFVPSGEWGTCLDATGTIDLIGSTPSTEALSRVQARFDLDLTPCNDSTTDIQQVNGTFNVLMRRGLDDVCAEM